MYFAFKYAIKKHKERQALQAQLSAEKNDQSDREAQMTGGIESDDATAGVNASVSTPEAEAKEAEVMEKKKADLSPEEAAEKKRRRSYRWKIMIGLFGPFALQALDTTVIASAFPYIATDFSTYSAHLPLLPQPNAIG